MRSIFEFTAFLVFCAVVAFYIIIVRPEEQDLKRSLEIAEDVLDVYIERDEKIEDIAKAMLVNYNITEYEAHYYAIMFYDFAKKYQTPWELYAAIVRYETNFNPTLTSKKHARGIMQLTESTAKELCKKLGIRYHKKIYWYEILSIVLGCTYLGESAQEGDIDYAIRVYVGGPAYAKNSAKNRETRQYVGEYGTTVHREMKRLQAIYKGIRAERALEKQDIATQIK
ncbi:MAG: transglycosylase SLT domain-containing protein [Candidatus Altiarchaeales archaeon]|nr:transglycosylase SLT domain-containing protein [Candidatus Altiarchaeales archaeon]